MGSGGIGMFAGKFAESFAAGVRQRRLREQMAIEEEMKAAKEKRLKDQFDMTMEFKQEQAKKLDEYRSRVLQDNEEAASAITKYRQGQLEIQQKQLELQKKATDVQIWGQLDKAFDASKPKALRKLILKQTAKQLGVNPKSEEYKDFEAALNDDELAGQIKSALGVFGGKFQPGQLTALANGIMTGKVPADKILDMMAQAQQQQQFSDIMDGGGGGAEGVPTTKVPTSRITNPTPMAQQPGMGQPAAGGQQQGGDLPIPGMTIGGGPEATGEPQPTNMSAEEARSKALAFTRLGTDDARSQATILLQYARDVEAGKNKELKVVVDPLDPNKNVYLSEDMAEGMEAPSTRDVLTPEEQANTQFLKGLADVDIKRIERYTNDAEAARDMTAPLSAFRAANNSGQFETGTAGGLRASLSRMASFLGVSQDTIKQLEAVGLGDAKAADLMTALQNQIGLQMADKLGRVTNMSLGFIQEAGPGLLKTKEGNDLIITMMEKANERALKIDDKIEEYRTRYGTLRPKGKPSFFEWVNKIRQEPLVDDKFLELMKTTAKKGDKIGTVEDILKRAIGSETLDLHGTSYDITGKTSKGIPILKLDGGKELPYAKTKDEVSKLTDDEVTNGFLWEDPEKGPVIVYKKPKAKK